MVNKKYLLLAGLCSVLGAQPVLAQESGSQTSSTTQWSNRDMTYRGETYDVLDSNYVPSKRLEQHRKFLNHQYQFPAKPRNMWEIGVGGGLYNISGDVPSLMLWNKGGYGLGIHVRKALGYVLSIRAEYDYGIGKGLEFQPSYGYWVNPAWNGKNNTYNYHSNPANQAIFYNYKTESHQLNLELVATVGNILFHKARTKVSPYVFAGIAGNAYQTWINALNSNFQPYDFASIVNKYQSQSGEFDHSNRRKIRKDLQAMMDNTYETAAESDQTTRRPVLGKKKLTFAATVGMGIQFRLSKRINLYAEDRVTFFPTTNEDLLDGQRWDEGTSNIYNANQIVQVPSQNKDGINYTSIGINFNLGAGKKNVEPLYWLNPLDYSYGEMSNPRHMVLPEPVLSDADGDGIADQFDKCPGTPSGVAVDSHGCPMDTDGDGVPDDRDKQLITPTECQPVDADGVGKCPCNCDQPVMTCGNIGAGAITFSSNTSKITPAMQSQLSTLAAQMQANPTCKVVIIGQGNTNKLQQQRSWDRVNAIIEFMSEKNGIDRNRFIFQYGQAGDPNTVMYRSAQPGEEGPGNVPPPFPNLRRN